MILALYNPASGTKTFLGLNIKGVWFDMTRLASSHPENGVFKPVFY